MKYDFGKLKGPSYFILKIVCMTLIVLTCINHSACRITEDGIHVLTGDYTAPCLTSFTVTSANTLELRFTEKISVISAVITSEDKTSSAESGNVPDPEKLGEIVQCNGTAVTAVYSDDDMCTVLEMTEPTEIGLKYVLYGEIADTSGNSLTFCIPFVGYNDRIPEIILNEIQTMYSKKSDSSYRVEYVEVVVLSDGNLSGLELYSAYDGEEKKYEFPCIDVKTGDYITVHLRSKETGCIDETGSDLTLSSATWSCDTARDLWADNTNAHLGNKEDVILLRDNASGQILDAVLYSESDTSEWKNDDIKSAAELAVSCGVWSAGSTPADAVCADFVTVTRTLSRQNTNSLLKRKKNGTLAGEIIPDCAGNWIVIDSGNETPGKVNSTTRCSK